MTRIEEILAFNKNFVEGKQYEAFPSNKFPGKKIAVISCMDTRLTQLLPAALNLPNGSAKIIQIAGAFISHPYGSVMRSLVVAIFELGVEDILVIGHLDCGMQGLSAARLAKKMAAGGVPPENLEAVRSQGVDVEKWLRGFDDTDCSVVETMKIIREHPLIPPHVRVHGFVIDPVTGKLDEVKV